ncbi:MAG: alpha/beta fold hydrolase, partial [Anaerolineales bacterium]|nr:alpha/beta fold hydrolase [Anaerolineales bacterium]
MNEERPFLPQRIRHRDRFTLSMNMAAKVPLSVQRFLKRPFIKWGGIAGVFFFLFGLLPAFTLAPVSPEWAPAPLRNWAYDVRLLIGRPITTLSSLQSAVAGETAVTLALHETVITYESDDLTITGTLYDAITDESVRQPAILLLHGSTPQGRKLGIYRMMGRELAALGYVVLTIDQRGFGQSDNPPDIRDADSFDFVTDAQNGLSYLESLPDVNTEALFLVGHSFGGDVAVSTAVIDNRIAKLVLIGPGRRYMERGGTPDAPEYGYFKRRQMRYMFLWRAIPDDVFQTYRMVLPLESHLDYFARLDHVPVLLVDGALESDADKDFLQTIFDDMQGEKVYRTLAHADHYANVANVGPLIVYDET